MPAGHSLFCAKYPCKMTDVSKQTAMGKFHIMSQHGCTGSNLLQQAPEFFVTDDAWSALSDQRHDGNELECCFACSFHVCVHQDQEQQPVLRNTSHQQKQHSLLVVPRGKRNRGLSQNKEPVQ